MTIPHTAEVNQSLEKYKVKGEIRNQALEPCEDFSTSAKTVQMKKSRTVKHSTSKTSSMELINLMSGSTKTQSKLKTPTRFSEKDNRNKQSIEYEIGNMSVDGISSMVDEL